MGTKSSLGPGHHPILGGGDYLIRQQKIYKKRMPIKSLALFKHFSNKGNKCSWCKECAA